MSFVQDRFAKLEKIDSALDKPRPWPCAVLGETLYFRNRTIADSDAFEAKFGERPSGVRVAALFMSMETDKNGVRQWDEDDSKARKKLLQSKGFFAFAVDALKEMGELSDQDIADLQEEDNLEAEKKPSSKTGS